MKHLNEIFKFGLVCCLILGFSSCNPDDDQEAPCCDPTNPACPNYDPCIAVTEPTADFAMQEGVMTNNGFIFGRDDSVFYTDVRYSALHDSSIYTHTWYLGAEVISDPVFSRTHNYSPEVRPDFITVSHVIEFPVDSTCFTNLTGRDSLSRTYYLIKYVNELAVYGNFRGVFENETDSFDFSFGVYDSDGNDALGNVSSSIYTEVNFHNIGDTTHYGLSGRNSIGYMNGSASADPRGFILPQDTPGIYKLSYKLYLIDFVVNARKLN
ncbi:hypothetical protein G3O08_19345 [Cryomorpha ignava]|uniref:Uncharacterized protein n=1 Tax=Cryomorpha ignava TaxID=101383 RepID=A0A7K3WVC2_9FLAO|nr:hypothetical protein [Cryomorpha ignava]NEN25653.1 hypothetical protein [Cryomorpha ignava]